MITIRQTVEVRAPVERCFDLARSVDLHVDSAAGIGARATGGRTHGLSENGDETRWSARFLGLRFSMTTITAEFVRPAIFHDRLTAGLLRRFQHVYRFEPLPGGHCAISDELTIEAPFGPLGKLAERWYLQRRMNQLVGARLEAIKAAAEGSDGQRYLRSSTGSSASPASAGLTR